MSKFICSVSILFAILFILAACNLPSSSPATEDPNAVFDRVDNYAYEDGIIRKLFNKAYNELKGNTEFKDIDPEKIQAAYFASRKTRTGEVVYEDSKTGESEKDKEAYDLIMRDKERLLTFDEPTCFIFSHSALREGWDSPNVFQICTLNQTSSEMKKRQEIGRGVRLAINQQGDRVHDEQVNVLTVVANESYEKYVGQYQAEVEAEFGAEHTGPRPANAVSVAPGHGDGLLTSAPFRVD